MPHIDLISGDRRADRRYEFGMELQFSYEYQGRTYSGSGSTEDLSSGGIRFRTDAALPEGAEVSLRIAWPFLLQNVCPLELLVSGSIVRTDARGTVLRMRDYEFKTFGERSFTAETTNHASFGLLG